MATKSQKDIKVTIKLTNGTDTEFTVPAGYDGENGPAGPSAYEVWVAAQPVGADTSMEAYLQSMQGSNKTLKSSGTGGNFSFGYPDNPNGNGSACGKLGKGVYWKLVSTLYNAGPGNTDVRVDFWLTQLPCLEDGTLVSYRFVADYVTARNNATPTVEVWLICDVPPTHLLDIRTKAMTRLQRNDNGLRNGLDDLYPIAPQGEFANEPMYSGQYFYYG